MVNRVLQPQELEVFYVIPALRREFALRLKKAGRTQKDIAKLLGVTDAAVSQYISSKRAAIVEFPPSITEEISSSIKKLDSELSFTREIQHLLRVTRHTRVICQLHEKLGTAPKGCTVCFDHEKDQGQVQRN
ncbi:helix-turn-helix domain-containing protein [Candidatus Woesearchaeota archaeon]|nr:helix-turn-helix domain-containing protein [Candidatus Woesearchaeota archaeon]